MAPGQADGTTRTHPGSGSEQIFHIPVSGSFTCLLRESSGIPDIVIAKRLSEFLKSSLLQVTSAFKTLLTSIFIHSL